MKTLVTLPWALLCATCLGWLVIDVCFFLLCATSWYILLPATLVEPTSAGPDQAVDVTCSDLFFDPSVFEPGWSLMFVFFLLCTCFGRLICWYWCLLFCCVLPNIIFSFSAACCLSRIYGHWWLFICCVLPLDIFCCLLPSLNQHLQVQIKLLTSPAPIFSLTLLCLSLLLWLCLTTTTTRLVSFSAQFRIETHWSFELLFKKHRCLPGGWRQLREDQLVGTMILRSSRNFSMSLTGACAACLRLEGYRTQLTAASS